MKKILLYASVIFCAFTSSAQNKKLTDTTILQPVELTAIRAADKNPFAKTNITKAEIKKNNVGQDLPFLLNQTPSVVINSDAGTGIGYTGIRIRGSDATRVNVTVNGIPYNDAESQGTYFVDMPDIASSTSSIQVQRGVGTSSNGAGSFGGSINLSTNEVVKERNIEFNNAAGSYGSLKNTLLFNSGIFNKHYTVDARLSNIISDGYVDRANAKLKSFYFSSAYISDKNLLRLNIFSGKEKTYQAYYGIDKAALDTNRTYNPAGTEKPGDPYKNQVDDYTQTQYQLFYNHNFNPYFKGNIAIFLTRGKGFYEQYKADQKLKNYGLPVFAGIISSDLIRRLWLDNYFYGSIFSLQYEKKNTQVIIGGGANQYDGDHFGNIISATQQQVVPANYRYYFNDATKKDLSGFIKFTQTITPALQIFTDVQVRNVKYTINGFKDNPDLSVVDKNTFFNPKAGITFTKNNFKAYTSYSRAAKEPNRDDYEASLLKQPKPEILNDIETGVEYKTKKYFAAANFYHMFYKDQLVLTGQINDVGAYTRTNITKSFRTGIELQAAAVITHFLTINANVTFSKNKVKDFTEYIDEYNVAGDYTGQKTNFYKKADIAFSPNTISSIVANIVPSKNILISLTGKYVSKQFLDNTSNEARTLRSYYTQDVRVAYACKIKKIKDADFFVQVNNIFSRKYEPNGYTFSYTGGGALTTENYYFPMAPVNFYAGVNIRFD